jgi:hypothetical protein
MEDLEFIHGELEGAGIKIGRIVQADFVGDVRRLDDSAPGLTKISFRCHLATLFSTILTPREARKRRRHTIKRLAAPLRSLANRAKLRLNR